MADTFRVERYDPTWGGFRNDDLAPRGLSKNAARRRGMAMSHTSRQVQRVVNESTGEVIAQYLRGQRHREM